MKREVVEAVLEASRNLHPRETLLLLRGRRGSDGSIVVEEVLVPPLATFGLGFASFNPFALPLDPSIVGSAHSHPSGDPSPSVQDLNLGRGPLLMIAASPYRGLMDIHIYTPSGEELDFEVE
ncbi:MAG: peptidase [Thermoprotei archaeon]|nr:MAG: peptidase [Thermoprotei archaeon]